MRKHTIISSHVNFPILITYNYIVEQVLMLPNLAELLWRRNTRTKRCLGHMSCFIKTSSSWIIPHAAGFKSTEQYAPNNVQKTHLGLITVDVCSQVALFGVFSKDDSTFTVSITTQSHTCTVFMSLSVFSVQTSLQDVSTGWTGLSY